MRARPATCLLYTSLRQILEYDGPVFGASESTIRRDITTLANDNRVIRVHGGAMSVVSGGGMEDSEVSARPVSYTHLAIYSKLCFHRDLQLKRM